MTKHRKSTRPLGDYPVGYKRPPAAKYFPRGTGGNPRGRPKGIKSFGQLIVQALTRRVTVHENGRSRTMSIQEIIVQGVINDAARREPRALKQLFVLLHHYVESEDHEQDAAALKPDDRAIIESYIAGLKVDAPNKEAATPEGPGDQSQEQAESSQAADEKPSDD